MANQINTAPNGAPKGQSTMTKPCVPQNQKITIVRSGIPVDRSKPRLATDMNTEETSCFYACLHQALATENQKPIASEPMLQETMPQTEDVQINAQSIQNPMLAMEKSMVFDHMTGLIGGNHPPGNANVLEPRTESPLSIDPMTPKSPLKFNVDVALENSAMAPKDQGKAMGDFKASVFSDEFHEAASAPKKSGDEPQMNTTRVKDEEKERPSFPVEKIQTDRKITDWNSKSQGEPQILNRHVEKTPGNIENLDAEPAEGLALTENNSRLISTQPSEKTNTETVLRSLPRQIVEQIEGQMVYLRQGETRVLKITLHPESLGTLEIQIKLIEGKLSGIMVVDNEAAHGLISRQIDALLNTLEEKQLNFSQFETRMRHAQDETRRDQSRLASKKQGMKRTQNLLMIPVSKSIGIDRYQKSVNGHRVNLLA